jgi:hypothetical protein
MIDVHLVPIVLFVCIAFAIKAVLDARVRGKLIAANSSEELIRSMLVSEQQRRRYDSLHWGVVLICLAVGFALIEAFDWKDATPGAIAVLLGASGVGELMFYIVARKIDLRSDGARAM